MGTFVNSYLRVIYKGEQYFVIGQGWVTVPMDHTETDFIIMPTVFIAKVEMGVRRIGKETLLEVPFTEVIPLVSEIKAWLYMPTDL